METDFRNTLIIISAVIIAVIFIHGFITIRRNKNPYKFKATNEKIEPIDRGFDGSGFDQDGVSKPRIVSASSPATNDFHQDESIDNKDIETGFTANETELKPAPTPKNDVDYNDVGYSAHSQKNINQDDASQAVQSVAQPKTADISLTDSGVEHLGDLATDNSAISADIGDDITDFDYGDTAGVIDTPLYDTPITRPKPQVKKNITAKPSIKKKASITKKEAMKRNQIELNFDEPLDIDDMPSMSAIDDPTPPPAPTVDESATLEKQKKLEPLEPDVLVVSVVMPEGQLITGAALLPSLLTLGLRYGDMDIFHRHQDNAGNGKVTFSLANIMNPGTFDLDALENFTTCGVTLFMTLPNAGDAFEVFKHMMGAAKQISVEFGAQLLDDKRSVMTKQTEQHYMSKIREFERKNRIALSELTNKS